MVSTNFVTNVVDDGKARSLPEEATLKAKAPTAPRVDPHQEQGRQRAKPALL
jgi:hypothetical protein